ncbi:MAG: hypothetical protein AB7U75_10820 [Hyphomicrobiaceae bacterium]
MYHIPRSNPWPPHIDLSTLRETLLYMHDDMARAPGLEKLRDALALALKEAEAAEASARARSPNIINARFLPRRF